VKSFSRPGKRPSTHPSRRAHWRRNLATASVLVTVGALACSVSAMATTTATDLPTQTSAYNAAWQPAPTGYTAPANDGLGVAPSKIGHVWVIVLENHAVNASFSPLEGTENSYLESLPSQGAFLTNYYGTGHSSADNYTSMVSGQGPVSDLEDDCPSYNSIAGSVDTSGTPATNSDYGQLVSDAGTGSPAPSADAPPNDNGCVYPSSVKTIFNQLDDAGKSWKVYAQDLDPTQYTPANGQNSWNGQTAGGDNTSSVTLQQAEDDCGAPDESVGAAPTASASNTYVLNDGSSNATSQYVAKHDPLPWFQSMLPSSLGGSNNDCATHLAPVFGSTDELYGDLQSTTNTPDFSFIVPNNCSNGHDAVCKGNNLSGEAAGYPTYNTSSAIPAATGADASTGGTYSESNFLGVVIPEIEASPAFQQNGLIVVTYDEAYPAFTYSGDSQANSQLQQGDATSSLAVDSAGETLYGRSLNWEPTGPNATVVTSPIGQALSAGPGDSAYLDRPTTSSGSDPATGGLIACPNEDATLPSGTDNWVNYTSPNGTAGSLSCLPGFQADNYGAGQQEAVIGKPATGSAAATTVTIASSGSAIADTSANVGQEGAEVYADTTPADLAPGGTTTYTPLPASDFTDPGSSTDDHNVYVGQVQDSPAQAGTSSSPAFTSSSGLTLVNSLGEPLTASSAITGVFKTQSAGAASDPFYNAYDPTLGGGDTGAVLISPLITPGTVSNTYYNHYSLLRSLEDIFGTTGGVDGSGHLGFAAQPGLAPFGSDVFTNVPTASTTVTQTQTRTVTQTATVSSPGGTTTVTTPGNTRTVTDVKSVVPYVSGDSLGQAKKAISVDRLKVGKVKGSGVVATESPRAGSEVKTGTKVSLTLRKK
jgi:hypothetical protein